MLNFPSDPRNIVIASARPALAPAELRAMTPAEVKMARALGACPAIRHSRHKALFRALHASALTDRPSISSEHAAMLRAGVRAMKSHLPPAIVDLAAGEV